MVKLVQIDREDFELFIGEKITKKECTNRSKILFYETSDTPYGVNV